MPPGRTRSAAARSSSSWSSGSGCARQRRSGRAASTPRPEHGASTSARSKPARSAGSARPSAWTTRTFRAPSRLTFSSSSRARASFTSTATTSPASIVAFPPGAAQRSSMRSPGCAPTQRPASWEPRLCGQTRPSASASSSTRCDAPRAGNVRRLAFDLAANEADDGLRRLVLRAHQRERPLLAEIAPPDVPDPVRVRMLQRPLGQRVE